METATVLCIIIGLVVYIYRYFKRKFSYWEKANIPYLKPSIPLGNMEGWKSRIHPALQMQKFYNHFKTSKHLFGGIYVFTKPVLLVLDLEVIRNILVNDFDYFIGRGISYNEKEEPLSANLFNVQGRRWQILRTKLCSIFTPGRIKFMFPTIIQVADEFERTLKTMVSFQTEVELKDILERYIIDVIGTCAFGIECNSLKDPNDEFRRMGKKICEVPENDTISTLAFKRLVRFLAFDDGVSNFFMKIVNETVKSRENNNVHRNDFMDLLMQLMKTGRLLGNQTSEITGTLTVQEIAAQSVVFFLAGYETSTAMMTYCLYELALNQNIQDKARQVINEVLDRHGTFTYEAMMEMTYIDQIINESLRKYPPGGNLIRRLEADYVIPGTLGKCKLDKGCTVWIPVYAIHHDPDIYPNPEIFDPERFTPEAVRNRHAQAFLPFGDGPRHCIGLHFGMMQTRIGLVTLLIHFRFRSSSKTNIPLNFATKPLVLSPEDGLWLNVEQIC